jgi:hypothetical protein
MRKFLLICSAAALLYGDNVLAIEYNDAIYPKYTTKSILEVGISDFKFTTNAEGEDGPYNCELTVDGKYCGEARSYKSEADARNTVIGRFLRESHIKTELTPDMAHSEFYKFLMLKPKQRQERINTQSKIKKEIPEICGKLVTEITKEDVDFEDLNLKTNYGCRLIVNGEVFGERRHPRSLIDAKNALARDFLNEAHIKIGRFASDIAELLWFLDTKLEKDKEKYIY